MIGSSSTEAEDWTDELLRALSAILRPTIALVVEEALAQGSGPWRLDRSPSPADRLEAPGLWAVLPG